MVVENNGGFGGSQPICQSFTSLVLYGSDVSEGILLTVRSEVTTQYW